MEICKTPIKNKLVNGVQRKTIIIPPSPLMQKLGYGTGVAVYKLERSPIFNRIRSPWALKKVSHRHKNKSEVSQRLNLEASILRQLKHPNIVGFRAFVQTREGGCLAMEECSKSLGDLIEIRFDDGLPPFEASEVITVASDIAKALKYLHHEALILHCDIKSYNVLIKGDFEICKLCDFGVSMPLTKEGVLDEAKIGSEYEYVGTPTWAAPELLNGNQIITTKADIYSYGLVLWEMLALTTPPLDDDSNDSFFEENKDDGEIKMRVRPDLPDCDFGEEYNCILELYYCCTELNYKKRLTAIDLCLILTDIKE